MPLPNFLVIGASKSGTTALHRSLKQHPQIFMSPTKEPRYFAFCDQPPRFQGPGSQRFNRLSVYQRAEYLNLFAQAGEAKARGESSPIYLSCFQTHQTAHNIHREVPEMRLIALLRQPADRIWSNFCHQRRNGNERVASLPAALATEETRARQNWIYPLLYRRHTAYDVNLAPYLARFDRAQIRIFLFEEWCEKPVYVMQEIFRFLEVDDSFVPTPRAREYGWTPRSFLLQRLFIALESHLPARLYRRTFARLQKYNRTRVQLDPELRHQITQAFTPNIHRLEEMIGRDLSHWLATPT